MYSTERPSGIPMTRASVAERSAGVASGLRSATTPTFSSTYDRLARNPAWTIQNPASSSSISVIVAVAARLIAALRQKPCQAREMLKNRKENIGRSAGAVVRAADLVAYDPGLFEGH